jgi:hypothetical protein
VERALRHVEHAADRCREFAQLSNGNQELWVRSQETWEWIRRYLTRLWLEQDVDGVRTAEEIEAATREVPADADRGKEPGREDVTADLPLLPGAASTLRVASRALKATPLSVWRETVGALDPEAPTREEAVQTILGVARILSAGPKEEALLPDPEPAPAPSHPEAGRGPFEDPDPDQVSFEFAKGYDEGYQMGRKVGLALAARNGARSKDR